jgi:hypothetical protein
MIQDDFFELFTYNHHANQKLILQKSDEIMGYKSIKKGMQIASLF